MQPPLHGTVAPGFEPVLEAFRTNFTEHGELGASFAVWQGHKLVVDLWGGHADPSATQPWQADTLSAMFSATKGLVAACFLHLTDRGDLDLDDKVAHYWPGFGARGREAITVRMLLEHRSGLSAIDQPLRLDDVWEDPERTEAALLAQEPLWKPGTHQGYGATVWGLYAGALFRHVTGTSLGRYLKQHITKPLQADVYLGTPREEHDRCATVVPVPPAEILKTVAPKILGARLPGWLHRPTLEGTTYGDLILDRASITHRAFTQPAMGKGRLARINEPAVRIHELPWMNAHGTAKGLATVYAALANKGRHQGQKVWRKPAIDALHPVSSWAYQDRVLHKPLGFNQGFQKEELHLFSPHAESFGHTGAGGSFGWADPSRGLGFAYVCNRMDHHLRSPRAIRLARAIYESVDGFR